MTVAMEMLKWFISHITYDFHIMNDSNCGLIHSIVHDSGHAWWHSGLLHTRWFISHLAYKCFQCNGCQWLWSGIMEENTEIFPYSVIIETDRKEWRKFQPHITTHREEWGKARVWPGLIHQVGLWWRKTLCIACVMYSVVVYHLLLTQLKGGVMFWS